MLRAGQMRTRLVIQRRATTQDGLGEQAWTWNSLGYTYGQVDEISGREILSGQAIHAEASHLITCRYFPGLTAKDRMVYTTPEGVAVYYNVTRVVDVEKRHRVMECTAVEGTAEG